MFKKALILMIVAEALSLLSFVYTGFALPLLIVIGVLVFAISIKRLDWGVYILFGELFFGSRGRLLEHDIISLRMVIFAAVFLAWIVSVIRSRELVFGKLKYLILNTKFLILYTALIAAVVWGSVWGVVNGNALVNVFNDANGYLYLLILPVVLSVFTGRDQIKKILQILGAAIVIVALKTLFLFIWFAGDWFGVATLYHWVITQDIGEITGVVGSASRIFMQSQFYSLMGVFVFGALYFLDEVVLFTKKQYWLILVSAIFAVVMSLSRSFWLGAVAGSLFFAVVLITILKVRVVSILKFGLITLVIVALQLGGLYLITAIVGGSVSGTVASRIENPVNEAAGSARLLLLPELLDGIQKNPLFGSGFGAEASYSSFLPDRVTKDNPDGRVTTFSFEWGYLDMLLKIGGFGLIIYLLFIANIFKQGWENFKLQILNLQKNYKLQTEPLILNTKYLILGLLAGLVALVVLNVTTPYLNHPLGIGYLTLLTALFNVQDFDF